MTKNASLQLADLNLWLDEYHPERPRAGRDTSSVVIGVLHTQITATMTAQNEADEMRKALHYVRMMLASGRTVGNDWKQHALDAENFIIGIEESRPDKKGQTP